MNLAGCSERPAFPALLEGVFAFLGTTLHNDELSDAEQLDPSWPRDTYPPGLRDRIASHLRRHFRLQASDSERGARLADYRLYCAPDMADALALVFARHLRGEDPEQAFRGVYCLRLPGPMRWVDIDPLREGAKRDDLDAFLDPDGDGIDSGVENFFGTHPGEFSQGLLAGTKSGDTFTHPKNATPASDLTAAYRWSTDLVTFHGDGESAVGTTVSFSPVQTPGLTTVTATISGPPVSRLFAVVRVSRN